ncbi:MaoC/PaaZ C-terminal domain-containing protein [Phytohabitans sp. ZYX-F-186]|uniref:MaoC/PaaZ C-terminal domain-containing protein n=1 Tax=Phytohabitans maris TaxID=3071409 RepID=A0ABU0ZUY6_9ACTN|nr:MaoC/PaaZ C-terminal domain-containing protein [Phytohabitans sp. ZYX-F-186]MDQ7910849.1 MaoC/PaaZ C-terminal domain-containing protein [Phytohabitans sp. ZYX-F-186]
MQVLVDGYFDDLEPGYTTGPSRGRTITETDVVHFMMLTGNWAEIHSNVEFVKGTPYRQRLVQGSLVLAISQGLFTTGRAVAAFYGLDRLRFPKPVFIGDTIAVECALTGKKDRDERFGLATWRMTVRNQDEATVQVADYTMLTYRTP